MMKGKSIIKAFLICAALIFVVLTSGCAVGPTIRTYGGDKLQKSEVAVIKGWWLFALFGYGGIDIYSIDDSILQATKVEVLPGWHELIIRDYSFSFVAPVGAPPNYARVVFNFEAGHEYKIESKGTLTIVDVSTGAIILSQPWPSDRLQKWVQWPFERGQTWVHVNFQALIRPFSEKELTWSEDEVNTIKESIATVAQRHGLKQEKTPKGYIACYSGKSIDLKAYYSNAIGWGLNTKDQTGTIVVGLVYDSGGPTTTTYLERKEIASVLEEICELLHERFGKRIKL